MLYYIIFEPDDKRRELYVKVIRKMMFNSKDAYTICDFKEYTSATWKSIQKLVHRKIYLISAELGDTNGYDLARKIRSENDISSQIIILTSNRLITPNQIRETMLLSIIIKNSKFINNLMSTLQVSFRLLTLNRAYTISIFDETYRILYDDIYYIEKNTKDDTITIFTRNDTYMEYSTIKKIASVLEQDPRFLRTSRSCIVNLFKVAYYDACDNILIFDNGMKTNLISREYKKILSERFKANLNKFIP